MGSKPLVTGTYHDLQLTANPPQKRAEGPEEAFRNVSLCHYFSRGKDYHFSLTAIHQFEFVGFSLTFFGLADFP